SGRLVKLKSTERIDSSVTAPDGTQILFNDTGKRLWLFDGKRFTHLATDIKHFLFSFDGKTIAYIDQEDTLFLSRNGKPTRVASQVSPLIRLSPDGKAVAYVREEGDSLKAFYYDGREHEIAREAVPAAISAQGRYVYYYSSKGVLYVQKGSNTDLRQKLVDQVEHLCLNASGDQILVSDGTYTYFSEKGGERIKLSSQSLSLLPASGVAMSYDGFYGAQDLKGLYYQMRTEGGTTVYQLNRRLELGSLLKNILSPSLQPDGKTLIFSKNENLYYMNLSNTDRGEIKLADRHRGFCVSRDGKHVLFLNEEGETWFVTLGQSARRITADTVEIREAASLENSFVFELEGVLYFTNGNRSSKVSGLSDDVKTVAGSGFWILAECQNGEVFLSTNGKSFTRFIRK
ncbi:MAG: PD40 domain-containing protein, partial [Lachnospiraceae bacterium]|nr:PD40 domain-containing protein [Lachnospiraceae bacterium]